MSAHDHTRTSPEGFACGAQLVRLTEPTIAALAAEGEPDERCRTCAFRSGTVPNGCAQTMADAIKCVVEAHPFLCHQHDRKGLPCHGWYAARVALRRAEERSGQKLNVQVPWDFSPPDEDFDKVEAAHAKRERKAKRRAQQVVS